MYESGCRAIDNTPDSAPFATGDVIKLYESGDLIFYGEVQTKEKKSETGTITYSCTDLLYHLLRSTGVYNFSDTTAEGITEKVCADFEIETGTVAESKEVEWLWYPYIPYGKITICQGDPGQGKTTFILQISALLSKGEKLPCDNAVRNPINIIYQSAEDGLEDTIKPRLLNAGADCSRILVIDESNKELTMTDERLVEAIGQTRAKLMILDPIQAYLGSDVDMYRANEIRPVLKRLGAIAEKYECAIVLIGHMNKASGSKSTYRGLGSIDFQATARSVLVVGRLKEKPHIRIIAHDKSSLAPEGKLAQSEILGKANAIQISKRVLDQAKKDKGIKSVRENNKWYWERI